MVWIENWFCKCDCCYMKVEIARITFTLKDMRRGICCSFRVCLDVYLTTMNYNSFLMEMGNLMGFSLKDVYSSTNALTSFTDMKKILHTSKNHWKTVGQAQKKFPQNVFCCSGKNFSWKLEDRIFKVQIYNLYKKVFQRLVSNSRDPFRVPLVSYLVLWHSYQGHHLTDTCLNTRTQ